MLRFRVLFHQHFNQRMKQGLPALANIMNKLKVRKNVWPLIRKDVRPDFDNITTVLTGE
jgi:hypothetical protein